MDWAVDEYDLQNSSPDLHYYYYYFIIIIIIIIMKWSTSIAHYNLKKKPLMLSIR